MCCSVQNGQSSNGNEIRPCDRLPVVYHCAAASAVALHCHMNVEQQHIMLYWPRCTAAVQLKAMVHRQWPTSFRNDSAPCPGMLCGQTDTLSAHLQAEHDHQRMVRLVTQQRQLHWLDDQRAALYACIPLSSLTHHEEASHAGQDFRGAFFTRSEILIAFSAAGLARTVSVAVTFFFTICTTSSSMRECAKPTLQGSLQAWSTFPASAGSQACT